jgi:hypothetical protein
MAEITLNVGMKREDIEPDGSECSACGDSIYLKAFGLRLIVNGKEHGLLDFKFCQSCGDVFK